MSTVKERVHTKIFLRLFLAAFVICSAALPLYSATDLEVLTAIEQKWNSLPGVDPNADNQELLAFVRTIPELSDSGLDTRCSCVWARFGSGPLLVLANNSKLQGPPPPASVTEPRSADMSSAPPSQSPTPLTEPAAPAPSAVELPKSGFVRLLNARGPDMADPVPDLRSWLTDRSYSVLSGESASVESLRSLRFLGGDGVFYINAYGAWVNNIVGGTFVLSTATVITDITEADPDIQADKASGQLTYMIHDHNWDPVAGKWIKKKLYAINAQFVRSWQDFAPNSFVFIDACDSEMDADFKQAFFDKKASVYAGWNESVSITASPGITKFFFDRLPGGNHVVPEADGFKQRAFDYVQVGVPGGGPPPDGTADADWHGMNDFPAFVRFTVNPAQTQTSFGLLAPSILLAFPYELDLLPPTYTAGTLEIRGIFGTDPRPDDPDSRVTVGGVNCPIKPGADGWQPDTIRCDLPGGAAGDVVVTVRKHDSNKARLTKWDGAFRYSIDGNDTLKVVVTYHAVFRADVRKFRETIHNPPVGPLFLGHNLIAAESSASFTCSGSSTIIIPPDTTSTITWTGAGTLPASRVSPPGPSSFLMALAGVTTVTVGTQHGGTAGCDWTRVTVSRDGTDTQTGHWDLASPDQFDLGAVPVEPTDPSFPAGSKSYEFCDAPPTFTPAQCRTEWNTITAMFPPDATSAR